MNRWFVAWLVVASTGCGDTLAPTQVMLVLDAEAGVRSQTREVQVVVRGGTGEMERWQERLDRSFTFDNDTTWPLEIALLPLGGDASRVYEATATAVSTDEEPVARVRAVSGYSARKTLMLRLVFEDDCRDQVDVCDETQTCRAGSCVDADVAVGMLRPFKPHTRDASIDASTMPDADGTDGAAGAAGGSGNSDAGDAGLIDAGEAGLHDGAVDGATDSATQDAATCPSGQARCDGMTCVDISGSCPPWPCQIARPGPSDNCGACGMTCSLYGHECCAQ